ncbi:MAG: TonB-dependent receptor [Opitutae bacterium]|nr:TonB-dependent receptor [Opitutae bacterium]
MFYLRTFPILLAIVVVMIAGSFLYGSTGALEPMEVSTLRLETSSKNLTARVQVIDQTEIEQSGTVDLVELLRREANLQVRSTSGNSARSTVSMGGFGENGGLRTLVLLDGHRLNAIDMSTINWYSIPLALVDSIEVIRGGQSGTFGNHGVGGVIKINTKLPKVEPSGSLEASAGSFDTFNARGAYSQRIGGMGLTIFGDRAESDGYRVNGDQKTDAGGVRLDWGSESDLRGYLSWSLSNTAFGFPGDLNASALLADRRQTTDPNNRGMERSSRGRAGLTYEINDNWSLENRLGYQDREVSADMPSMFYLAETNYESFSYGPALHYNSNVVDWMFGMDFTKDTLDAKTNYGDSAYERSTSAFFTSTGLPLSDQWNLNGNFRVERAGNSGVDSGTQLNEVNKDEWAGGIGLIREFGNENRVYGTIRRFYRYAATDEYAYSINKDLEPENGYEVELGMDWNVDQIFLSGRIFRQWMEGEIIYDPLVPAVPFNGSNVNLPKNRRVGLDLSMDWQISESIRSGVSYEYVRATFEEDNYPGGNYSGSRVPLVPEGLVRLFLELHPVDSLLLSLGGSYVGESFRGSDFSNTEAKMEDYWLYDLGINYVLSESATLFGSVENLLDEEYLSTAFGSGLYPGEGREVRVGLRLSF